jgi:hypothetical protein
VRIFSKHAATWLGAAVVGAGALGTAGAFALSGSATAGTSAGGAAHTLTVRQIVNGAKLHHAFQSNGKGAWLTESLSSPDDLTELGGNLFVNFQNGVGAQGEASADGNLDSTIGEFTPSGREVRQWDLRGKSDGLTADPYTGQVLATINEDANSSLDAINPRTGAVADYSYSEPLPHKGGTDSIAVYHGQLLVSASAPGTTGAAAPQPAYPAVYVVTLDPWTRVAKVVPLYYDEATATAANGPKAGQSVTLGLTDPDSSEVVPGEWPRFSGDFLLDSQGDQELIFDRFSGWRQHLSVLSLPASVDDTAFVTTGHGVLYTSDNSGDTVDAVTGARPGTTFTAVTPCNANSAPATCPAPGYPANYLATLNLQTGAFTPASLSGPALQPQGLIFVP